MTGGTRGKVTDIQRFKYTNKSILIYEFILIIPIL